MARNGQWERVEPHLYRLKHQTPPGEWTTRYYVRLKDWKGIKRSFPAGTDLRGARSKKKILLGENERRVDFDKDKQQALTFAPWAALYLEHDATKKRSFAEDQRHVQTLSAFFGKLLLSQITTERVEEFKQLRKDRLTWRGTPVSNAYCNRELECLRPILRLAVEKRLIDSPPTVKLHQEDNARDMALSEEEYQRLLAVSPLHLRRIIICGYETGMRAGEIAKLTWDKVDLKSGFIRLAAEDTKTNTKRAIPLSPLLRETVEEIHKEQRDGKVAPIGGHVFTWQGKPLYVAGETSSKPGMETLLGNRVPKSWSCQRALSRLTAYLCHPEGARGVGL